MSETWTICDLHDDLDLMRVVTSMLNTDNSRVKNYKDLADECGISSDLYQSLQPPCAGSSTKEVLEEIVGRKPNYTVEELFTNLHDMERLDAIEAIRCYFIGKEWIYPVTYILYKNHHGLRTFISTWISPLLPVGPCR